MKANIVILLLFIYNARSENEISDSEIKIFLEKNFDTTLNNFDIDDQTGDIFIGGTNKIIHTDSNFNIIETAITGPKEDSYECNFKECPAHTKKQITNNYNKVLLIDHDNKKIIACGSIFQGSCNLHDLKNISTIEEIKSAVAANDDESSTYAFIAPGVTDQNEKKNVMYVGTKFTNNSKYRHDIPAISSRNLLNMNFENGIKINPYARSFYLIDYIYGFSYDGFSYFLTKQLKYNAFIETNEIITKIVRICQSDSSYKSYMEVPLECMRDDKKLYNIVSGFKSESTDQLFTIFLDDKDSMNSVVCIYSLETITKVFNDNHNSCKSKSIDLDHISRTDECNRSKINACGLTSDSPIYGDIPIAPEHYFSINANPKTISAHKTDYLTLLFIGTIDGHLKKYSFDENDAVKENCDLIVEENSAIIGEMKFDSKNLHLYAMTKNKIFKIIVHDCNDFKNCNECYGSPSLGCGFCATENKCSLQSNCKTDENFSINWSNRKTAECLQITKIFPKQVSKTVSLTLQINVENLVATNETLFCAFTFDEGNVLLTNVKFVQNTIQCKTPRPKDLPNLKIGENHIPSKLSIRSVNDYDIATIDFNFYECRNFMTCTTCVSTPYPCDWCIENGRCTHDTTENCRNDILVSGITKQGPVYRGGPKSCPRIEATALQNTTNLILHDTSVTVKVNIKSIGAYGMDSLKMNCQFIFYGQTSTVKAQLVGDTVQCDWKTFKLPSKQSNATVDFSIVLKQSGKLLDNPNNFHLIVYNCRYMSDNCKNCLLVPEKYKCGWCLSSNKCETEDKCTKHSSDHGNWLETTNTCPSPEIQSFYPNSGPIDGGTNVTIRGIGFTNGAKVKIGLVDCIPFIPITNQNELICQTESTMELKSGKIIIETLDSNLTSISEFHFVQPIVDRVFILNSKINIVGKYLDSGSQTIVKINEKIYDVRSQTDNEIICRADAVAEKSLRKLKLEIDNFAYELKTEFELKKLRGFPAGGVEIKIKGKGFLPIDPDAKIVVSDRGKLIYSTCETISNEEMICKTPIFDIDSDSLDQDRPKIFTYSIEMDGIFNKLSDMFELYPNPKFFPFENEIKYTETQSFITLNGQNLNLMTENDINIMIGDKKCDVVMMARLQLTCKPLFNSTDKNKTLDVLVNVGNLKFNLGKLKFSD